MFGHNEDHHKDEEKVVAAAPIDDVTAPTVSAPTMSDGADDSSSPSDDMSAAVDALATDSKPEEDEQPSVTPPSMSAPSHDDKPAADKDGLLSLKREALEDLAPLVSHLDQAPEERFKTTMMMIQATDDSSLIKKAYEAAKEIKDEKVRAQALLDIVNEINYFTQQQGS